MFSYCRRRFLHSNQNWPQEAFYEQDSQGGWHTLKHDDFYGIIDEHGLSKGSEVFQDYTIKVIPKFGDIAVTKHHCRKASKCYRRNKPTEGKAYKDWGKPKNGTNFVDKKEMEDAGCTRMYFKNVPYDQSPSIQMYLRDQHKCTQTPEDINTNIEWLKVDYPEWPKITDLINKEWYEKTIPKLPVD